MKNILSKVCFTLFIMGVSMADSKNLLIPIVITFTSLITFMYLTKEEN